MRLRFEIVQFPLTEVPLVVLFVLRPGFLPIAPLTLRRCVNAKVSEMAVLEKEAKKRSRRVPLVPKVFLRKNSNGSGKGKGGCGVLPRPTLREMAEAREELMKLVVFLHLRE